MPHDHDHGHGSCGDHAAGGGPHSHAGHRHAHGHSHGFTPDRLDRAMAIGVGLNVTFVVIEIVAGFAAGSLALLADAGHNAGDVVGLLLAWGAAWLARRAPTPRYTWGLRRATIWAALANAVLLFLACGGIIQEALHRWWNPVPVAGTTMIAVAACGVVVNALTAALFSRGAAGDVNLRGAYLHMVADAAVSAGVVVAGTAILLTGRSWIDPAVGIAITVAILVGTWGLFRESLDLALDAVPRGIDPGAVGAALAAIPGVAGIHDLHIWNASTSEISLTAHLVVPDPGDGPAVLAAASREVRERFAISHTTIQIEGSAVGEACPQRPADTL